MPKLSSISRFFSKRQPVLTPLIVLAGGIIAFNIGLQKFATRMKLQREFEFYKNALLDQAEIYKKGCRLTGEVVAKLDKPDSLFIVASDQFEAFYWGEMNFIVDSIVYEKGFDFRLALHDLQADTIPENMAEHCNIVKISAKRFIDACRAAFLNLRIN